MKKFFAIIFVVLGLSAQAQQGWRQAGNYSRQPRANTNLKHIGFMAEGGVTWITGRAGLPTTLDGQFQGGVFFGGGNISVLLLAGITDQSELIKSSSGQMYWDPMCGCQTAQSSDSQNYLRVGYGQLGIAFQGEGYALNLTGGVASVARSRWVEIDSTQSFIQMPRVISPMAQISGQFKAGRDLILIEGQIVPRSEFMYRPLFARGRASYLLGVDKHRQQLFVGVQAGYIQHAVSGHEFLLGPHLVLNGGPQARVFNLELAGGVAYNPNPQEGLGLFITFVMKVNRQNKLVY